MQPIAIEVACHVVCLYVGHTDVGCKTDQDADWGVLTHVLDVGRDPLEMGEF